MTQHTQGPWEVVDSLDIDDSISVGTELGGLVLADVAHHIVAKDEALANARLIAKAPELLAAVTAFAAFASYVVGKEFLSIPGPVVALDQEDMENLTLMLSEARLLLAGVADPYPVPEGLQRRAGVEAGCGSADCTDCYEPEAK